MKPKTFVEWMDKATDFDFIVSPIKRSTSLTKDHQAAAEHGWDHATKIQKHKQDKVLRHICYIDQMTDMVIDCVGKSPEEILEAISMVEAKVIDQEFEEFELMARAVKVTVLSKLKILHERSKTVIWAVFDNRGFYDYFSSEVAAYFAASNFNEQAAENLKPFTVKPLGVI